ncbi:MAG: hypothetical protein ACYC1Z_14675 [Georgenia sp.]
MRMIAPRTGAPEITVAEEQHEYLPITVALYDHPDGVRTILARFTFTPEERAAVAAGADVYFGQLNFGGPMTPINACVGAGDWQVSTTEAP